MKFYNSLPCSFQIPCYQGKMIVCMEIYSRQPDATEDSRSLQTTMTRSLEWEDLAVMHTKACRKQQRGDLVTYRIAIPDFNTPIIDNGRPS